MKRYQDNKRFSATWFLNQARQNFSLNLGDMAGTPCTALEVGSFEGRSACFMMEEVVTHPDARMICVDPYNYSSTKAYARERLKDKQISDAFKRFMENTMDWQISQRLTHYMLPSHVVLRDMVKVALDFVYVDGSHYGSDCLTDMVLSWTLLKQGGIMAVDDVHWRAPKGTPRAKIAKPLYAIEFFRRLYQGQFVRLRSTPGQFWIKRTVTNEMLPHNYA